MRHIKKITLFIALFSVPTFAQQTVWSTAGFDQPESVLHDTARDTLYVSNINGAPMEENGKGYISRVSPAGKILEQKWITGLNAPKGMALANGKLFIADLTKLHIIDIDTNKVIKSLHGEQSKMLNDVTIDDSGNVYVSDLLSGAIYRLTRQHDTLERWFEHAAIPHPNGVHYHQGKLLIGSWGKDMQDDFTTLEAGSIYHLNLADMTLVEDKNAKNIGNLDGVSVLNDSIISNDWINGNVFKTNNNSKQLLFNAGKGAADISVSNNRLYVPMMLDNRIDVYSLQ